MKNILFYTLCISTLLFVSCEGEKGEVGPQGIQGVAGAQGDKGDKGAPGEYPKTLTGSKTIKASEWQKNSVDRDDDAYYVVIPEKQITSAILEKGSVKVYLVVGNGATPLPFVTTVYRILPLAYLAQNEGKIRIDLHPTTYMDQAPAPTGDLSFRWVITPIN